MSFSQEGNQNPGRDEILDKTEGCLWKILAVTSLFFCGIENRAVRQHADWVDLQRATNPRWQPRATEVISISPETANDHHCRFEIPMPEGSSLSLLGSSYGVPLSKMLQANQARFADPDIVPSGESICIP